MKIKMTVALCIIGLFLYIFGNYNQNLIGAEQSSYKSEVISESNIELEAMNPDQIADFLDPNEDQQDFIILDNKQSRALRGLNITYHSSTENFSVINSSITGSWGVYKIGSKYIFCIEAGADVISVVNTTTEAQSKYGEMSSATKQHLSRIISIAMNQYKATDNEKYIYAAQLLIWEYVGTNEKDVVGNPYANRAPTFQESWTVRNTKLYSDELKDIEASLKDWDVLPSFLSNSKSSPQKHTLKYDSKTNSFSVTLTDSNGVWDQKYANYNSVGLYTLSNPSGPNNVKISIDAENLSYGSVATYTWTPYLSGIAEFYDGGQDLIYVGAKAASGYMTFKTAELPYGGFELIKHGQTVDGGSKSLEGVEFTVTSSTYPNFTKVYKTDSNGMIKTTSSELKYGVYTIEETSVSSRYIKDYKHDFTISDDGEIIQINDGKPIINNLYLNRIKITKVGETLDNNSNELIKLGSAKFEIYEDVGSELGVIDAGDIFVETIESDESGEAYSSYLPEGKYLYQEIQSPQGYILNSEVFSFEINGSQSDTHLETIQLEAIVNEVIVGNIIVSKVGVKECEDKKCTTPLANVKFAIYDQLPSENTTPIDYIVTNDKGIAASMNLKYGNYYLKEIENNDDKYLISDHIYEFKIENHRQVLWLNDGKPIENYEKVGNVAITKTGISLVNGSDQIVFLSNATYTIYDEDNNSVYEITTDENGQAKSSSLSFGKYTIVETVAPLGYELDQSKYQFEISSENYQSPVELKFADDVIKNDVKISKIDSKTKNTLAGAKLEIIGEDSKEPIYSWTSNKEGMTYNLKYGNYQVCETAAPSGYLQTDACLDFSVNNSKEKIDLIFENDPVKIAETGSEIFKIISILFILAVILGILKFLVYQQNSK